MLSSSLAGHEKCDDDNTQLGFNSRHPALTRPAHERLAPVDHSATSWRWSKALVCHAICQGSKPNPARVCIFCSFESLPLMHLGISRWRKFSGVDSLGSTRTFATEVFTHLDTQARRSTRERSSTLGSFQLFSVSARCE